MEKLLPPRPVDDKPQQVGGEQAVLEVGGEVGLVVAQLGEDVLGELGGGHPDDVDQEEDEEAHDQPLGSAQGRLHHRWGHAPPKTISLLVGKDVVVKHFQRSTALVVFCLNKQPVMSLRAWP